ncbi:response regulator transcription factor [Stenotrophomonas sp. PD6]|uniref:response regulator transcription factor n=1 Tax=Stenotrophomonas sp. PD6 TaxID=3368612 RepID=UPI003BA02237
MSAVVHIIDDDPRVLVALGRTLKADGLEVALSASPEDFLAHYDPSRAGCVVLDLNMPGMDGLALQRLLGDRGEPPVMIFVSGEADVASCACAMRAGALDFLTKPVDAGVLLEAVLRGIDADATARTRRSGEHGAEQRYLTLTPRERQVLPHIIAGRLNKQIAGDLGISLKTTKVHRSRIMVKFGVRSVAALVRAAELAHVDPRNL